MGFLLHFSVMASVNLIVILSYNLIFGRGRILHFGPIAVYLCSTYVIYVLLGRTESYVLSLFCGFLTATVLSAFFAWLSMRLEPDGFGIMSIAVHLAALAVILNWTSVTRGALGIPNIPRPPFMQDSFSIAAVSVTTAALLVALFYKLDHTSFGRKLMALAEHEWHAVSLGISRAKEHTIAFVLAGIGMTISLILYVPYVSILHPNDFLFPVLIFYVMCVVAGKPGNVLGVTLATILLVLLKEGLRFLPLPATMTGPAELLLFGLILFGAVWWRRDVLFPQQRSI